MMNEAVNKISDKIKELNLSRCIIAIDGRCASGKTTLAAELSKRLCCNVVHMDDFFLRPYQRTEKRMNETGGNIDYERFIDEIIASVRGNSDFCYRPFNCHSLDFSDPIKVEIGKVLIIEGSYSCHPKFDNIYDLKIFLDVDNKTQLERIEKRNGKKQLSTFENKWIPMEEKYFLEFNIEESCDLWFKL